jgi:transposase
MKNDLFFENEKTFSSSILIVGVDIGKNKHYAKAVSADGKFITKKAYWFNNRKKSIRGFIEEVKKWVNTAHCDSFVIALEPTGPYWIPLAGYVENIGIRVLLINPFWVRRSKEMYDNSPQKSDGKDALLIARLAKEGKYMVKIFLEEKEEELRTLTEYRAWLIQKKTEIINKTRSLLAEFYPEYEDSFSKLDGRTSLAILSKYPIPDLLLEADIDKLTDLITENSSHRLGREKVLELIENARESIGRKKGSGAGRLVLSWQARELKILLNHIEEIEKKINDLMISMPMYEILKSIPGVSTVTIASIISATGDLCKYHSEKEVLKVLGLNLYELSSGQFKGRRHITKRGNSYARACLFEAASGMCKTTGIFREKYLELRKKGKAFQVAVTALSCRLVKLMFVLVKKKMRFDKDIFSGTAGQNEGKLMRAAA